MLSFLVTLFVPGQIHHFYSITKQISTMSRQITGRTSQYFLSRFVSKRSYSTGNDRVRQLEAELEKSHWHAPAPAVPAMKKFGRVVIPVIAVPYFASMAYRVKLAKEGKGTSRIDVEDSIWGTNVHSYSGVASRAFLTALTYAMIFL